MFDENQANHFFGNKENVLFDFTHLRYTKIVNNEEVLQADDIIESHQDRI